MPIYEFACRKCNTEFEKIVPAAQRDSVECPACGNKRTMRKVSLAAPAQFASKAPACPSAEMCGQASCCGGACGLPN
ncbi:MAG: zinc ribbon domain-containing protein [Capsulimonadaceae bacterium]|nr:zinc ribbon domain-containing protein [Capsulimonadaceae bacterium]